MAEDDDVGVGVELLVRAGGDIAHGDEQRVGDAGGLELPGFADIEEDGGIGLGSQLSVSFGGDLGRQHGVRIAWCEKDAPSMGRVGPRAETEAMPYLCNCRGLG